MTPVAIYKAIRDFLVVAAIAFVVYKIYSGGENAVKAEQVAQLQKQVEQQSILLQQWHENTDKANETLQKSLDRINTAPVVVHDWVRAQSSCPSPVLSAPANATPRNSAQRGGAELVDRTAASGSQRDRILSDWKRFWEERLASCRLLYDSWPKP